MLTLMILFDSLVGLDWGLGCLDLLLRAACFVLFPRAHQTGQSEARQQQVVTHVFGQRGHSFERCAALCGRNLGIRDRHPRPLAEETSLSAVFMRRQFHLEQFYSDVPLYYYIFTF